MIVSFRQAEPAPAPEKSYLGIWILLGWMGVLLLTYAGEKKYGPKSQRR